MKTYVVRELDAQKQDNRVALALDDIGKAKRPEKATYSLYLSTDVKQELDKRAGQAGMAAGAYLDELLKRVFGI